MTTEINTTRRFYLLKSFVAGDQLDLALCATWRSKQEAQPGTALPATFPFFTTLDDAGYATEEDLDGADEQELLKRAGLNNRDAAAVLAALAEL